VNVMPAPLAAKGALRLDRIPASLALALRAGVALSEANVEQMLKARIVVRELLEKLADRGRLHGVSSPYD
jgi:hypothetical protein